MSLLLVAAAPIRAAAPPLSLGDALEIATRDARSLSASAAAAESARQMARAAKQLPDPVLRAGIDNLPIEGPDRFALGRESMTMRRIGVMQEYVSADKRAARQQRVEREADRADALGAALRAELRADVAAAWIDRIYAQRAERQLAALADELAMQQRTLQAQLAAGRAAAADVLAADAMNALTRDRAVAAGQQTAIATARLARWIGAHAQRPFADEALGGGAADAARAADYAIETHPQLRALQAEIEAAQSALRLAILDRQPNWSWEVAFAQRGSGFSNMVSFGVSVPLPIARGERQDREVAARAAQLDQAQQQLEDARRRLRAEFDVMRLEWQALSDRRQALETRLFAAARQRADAALSAYRGGQRGLADVLDARRAELEARLQVLELEREAARTWARLQQTFLDAAVTQGDAQGAQR